MVNMPLSLSAFPTKHIRLDTDMNHNINQEYYAWLLKQHNYFPDTACLKNSSEDTIRMEHSYTRDHNPIENLEVITTRTILMERPPPCPQCNFLPPNHDEKVDAPDTFNIPIPAYNEASGRSQLNAIQNAIKNCPNPNSDSDDWTLKIDKSVWTDQQRNLFERVEHILDMDQLARLSNVGVSDECLRRNAFIQKSVSRMRLALATVHWEPRLTQWLHEILMKNLSPAYMVSYIEILQILKRKIPTLVDKMLYDQPIDLHMDYMSAILKHGWEPTIAPKTRTLPNQPIIIIVPSSASTVTTTAREKKWIELLSTLSHVVPILTNLQRQSDYRKTFDELAEQLIAIVRAKIQEIRLETPNRNIILVGFNAGAAIAMQVALVEPVNSIVCLGFAYNTLHGVRGEPDDKILDLTTPVLFILGQNAQQSSQEEIESLREKMSAQTLLVVVGSSDHLLRVKRFNRTMEGISQQMIDNMIIDEIQDFATACILNPPGPRKPSHLEVYHRTIEQNKTFSKNTVRKQTAKPNGLGIGTKSKAIRNCARNSCKSVSDVDDSEFRRVFESLAPNEIVNMEPVLASDSNEETFHLNGMMAPSAEYRRKVIIPSNEFVHIKPPPRNTQKIYVKPHNTSDQTYTLGVNSIDSSTSNNEKRLTGRDEVSPMKTITLYKTSPTKCTEMKNINNTFQAQAIINDDLPMPATTFENIDLSDIPILFADNDGNLLNQTSTVPKTQNTVEITSEETVESIDILSAEIVDDSHNEETTENSHRVDETSAESMEESTPATPTKSTNNEIGGGFVVLNRNTMKHFKNVRHITHPPNKYRKIYVPTGRTTEQNGTLLNGTRMSISKVARSTKTVKFIPSQKILSSAASVSQAKQTVQFIPKSNTDQLQTKSGILIRKNHLTKVNQNSMNRGSFTVRRLSTFHHARNGQNGHSGGNAKPNKEKRSYAEDEQMESSGENETNNSIKALIADLES